MKLKSIWKAVLQLLLMLWLIGAILLTFALPMLPAPWNWAVGAAMLLTLVGVLAYDIDRRQS